MPPPGPEPEPLVMHPTVVDETRVEFAVAPSTPGYRRALGLTAPRPKGPPVSRTVLYMSMSLDGFIAGPNETPDNGLGDGGQRLHDWLAADSEPEAAHGDEHLRHATQESVSGFNRQVIDEFMATGAVVAGRGTVEPAGYWDGDHHDGAPIFIVSRTEPPAAVREMPLVTFVNDVATAMAEAKRAAGDKGVLVHGAGVTQLALAARVLDELEMSVVPVLLGQGRRLFDNLAPEHVELERTRVLRATPGSPTCTTASSGKQPSRATGLRCLTSEVVCSVCVNRYRETRRRPMTVIITAFDRSPDGGAGLARDTRVRWALEEVGRPLRGAPGLDARETGTRASARPSFRPDSDL